MPTVAPEDRVTQSDAELHVGMEVPRHSAKQIHNWVRQQEWPEGTELEHPSDYHVTLLYTPEGHREHKNNWWMSHMGQTPVKFDKFESFPPGPDGYPYVLRIDSPEIQEHANMLQNRAEAMGLPITKFPGGYKPHLTVGYGPQEVTGLTVPNFEFDIGPSSVSPVRPNKEAKLAGPPKKPPGLKLATKEGERCGTCEMFWRGRCWGYDRYKVQQGEVCKSWAPDERRSSFAEPISIEHIARRMQGEDIPPIVLMLKAAGWTASELNVQTVLQTYYELNSESGTENFARSSGDLSYSLSHQAQTRCLNCGSPLEDGRCPNCSTVPSQVNDPDDRWPDYGERPPDHKHDVQFSNDWGLKGVT